MLYLVFAVLGLHIISMPIALGVTVFVDTDENIGKLKVCIYGLPIFIKKLNLERLKARILDNEGQKGDDDTESEQNDDKEPQKFGAFKRFLLDCVIRIVKRIRVRNSELSARLGTGDAAVTAMTVGSFRVAYSQVCAFFGISQSCGKIEPDYDTECIKFDYFGIFSLCFADIIVAVSAAVIDVLIKHTKKRRSYANITAE
ncbi:MAG: DUF2953 domain-containing protein [Clostridiales bacterium]|nr:DUF2953 domain-containing protein [Clostridiales bacterium]